MNTLIFLLALSPGQQSVAPLYCPEAVTSKGDLKSGPALVHTFELTHRGAGTLTITRVEASCGCLRQSLSSGLLQPNETSKLTIEVNTLTQPEGQNRWQITVGYKVESPGTAPQIGEVLLQITANLKREIIVDPPQIGFSTSTGATKVLTLTDSRIKPLTITKVTTSSTFLTVELGTRVALPSQGQKQTVTIALSDAAPEGHRDEAILLLTDDPAYPELRIPVRVLKRAASSISVAPESVAIRFGSDQGEISTLVQLRSTDGKEFAIAAVESDHPGVSAKWSTEKGKVAVVRVTVTEAASTQSGNCKVRVKLDQAGREILIPVSWLSAKK